MTTATCIYQESPDIKLALSNNYHTLQFFCNSDNEAWTNRKGWRLFQVDTKPRTPVTFPNRIPYFATTIYRTLEDSTPCFPWEPNTLHMRTTLHWGQRKLLLTEIDFFVERLDPDKKYMVIYAGASPGIHIILLRRMFRNLRFHLIDPRPVDKNLEGLVDEVIIHKGYMTDELATILSETYKDEPLVFISDIRRDTTDESIDMDMRAQERWTRILRPDHAILKFRLPWSTPKYTYLKGELRFQPYAPLRSTETRLLVRKNELDENRVYDSEKYNGQCFFHNHISRSQYYQHNHNDLLYMDHCYDCTVEIQILEKYISSRFCKVHWSVRDLVLEITLTACPYNKAKRLWTSVENYIRQKISKV